jgi:hypothetical protein
MPPEAPVGASDLDLDALTVEQALIDFEIANERVRDLTYRLVASSSTISELQERVRVAEQRVLEAESLREEIEASQGYRLANRIWAIRRAFGI